MSLTRRLVPLLLVLVVCATPQRLSARTPAPGSRVVIAAGVVLDGRGRVMRDTRIVVEGSKIVRLDPKAGPLDYDLRGLTVLPGWIDAHTHITWSFGEDGKNAGADETTQAAGCTQVEHGVQASDDDLKALAAAGVYLNPQAGLVWENYLLHKERFVGTPGYPKSLEGFASMETLIPMYREFMRRAAKIPGLKIVYGTDALAGAHGRNAEEFIARVRECGVEPMAAMVSANSLGAEALGLGDRIGSIAPGFEADIIALDGDPLRDITAVRRVVFVMKGGVVYKNVTRGGNR